MASSACTCIRRLCTSAMLALVMMTSVTASAQNVRGTGVLVARAPMFLLPDATRTPLTTLETGTIVRVLDKEGDWYKVIFHDRFLGDRTGYVQAVNIRIETSTPGAPPAPTPRAAAPAQRNEPRSTARASITPRSTRWANRGYVSVNGMYQTTSNAFTGVTTLTQYVEPGTATTSYAASRPPVLDVGGRGRAWRNLAVGAAASWLSQSRDEAVSASLPHPLYFKAPRTVTGMTAGVPRQELALHGDVSWLVPAGRAAQFALFAGPSYFHVKQALVTNVNATEVYPYDTAAFASATTVTTSKSRAGFNAGADFILRVAKSAGVGVTARYSRASLQLSASTADTVSIRAGGLQIGGGLRFGF